MEVKAKRRTASFLSFTEELATTLAPPEIQLGDFGVQLSLGQEANMKISTGGIVN